MNAQTHGELASFIWSECSLLSGPFKRTECRKAVVPLTEDRRPSGAAVLTCLP